MFREPLETWELWGYPPLIALTMLVISKPLGFYPDQLLRLEVLSFTTLGVWEIWRSRYKRPGLARALLIGLRVHAVQSR